MIRAVPLLIALSLLSAPARAQGYFEDGNHLYEGCIPDGTKHIGTLRYIVGVIDGVTVNAQLGGKVKVCVPPDATAQQLNDFVCQWAQQHPADRNVPLGPTLSSPR